MKFSMIMAALVTFVSFQQAQAAPGRGRVERAQVEEAKRRGMEMADKALGGSVQNVAVTKAKTQILKDLNLNRTEASELGMALDVSAQNTGSVVAQRLKIVSAAASVRSVARESGDAALENAATAVIGLIAINGAKAKMVSKETTQEGQIAAEANAKLENIAEAILTMEAGSRDKYVEVIEKLSETLKRDSSMSRGEALISSVIEAMGYKGADARTKAMEIIKKLKECV